MSFAKSELAHDEFELLERASRFLALPNLDACDAESLAQVTAEHGIDFATAVLFDRVRRDVRHADLCEQVDRAPEAARRCNPSDLPTVVVVPGAFYREISRSGADGRRVLEEATRRGCRAERIELSGFGAPEENGRAIVRWLNATDARSIVLVTLSKGALDVKAALTLPDADHAFQKVDAWVNLSGTLSGTPLANWLLQRPLRMWLVKFRLWCSGYSAAVLDSIKCSGNWAAAPVRAPDHIRVVHVVGFPLRRHVSPWLGRRGHRRLSPLGPNDTAMVLADVRDWPGQIYPVWGADHYLNPRGRDLGMLFGKVLATLIKTEPQTQHRRAAPTCDGSAVS